jgi:molecular chaperone GrpE
VNKSKAGQKSDDDLPENYSDIDQSLASLNSRIQELEADLKEKEQKYLYLYSDFENFKKRTAKERDELRKFGWISATKSLVEVIDNLERALAHAPKTDSDGHGPLIEGIKMVLNQFKDVLENQGVQVINTEHQMFDPHLHEAVGQMNSDQPEGQILREEAKGYTLHGRLLRPARVVISSGPTS